MYLPKYFHHVYLFICIEIVEKWACPIDVFVDISHTEHYVTFFMHMPGILWGLMSGLQIRVCFLFSSQEPKAQGEIIVWDSSRRPCVRPFTLSNMNMSETSWSVIIKFYQKHHWGRGLIA